MGVFGESKGGAEGTKVRQDGVQDARLGGNGRRALGREEAALKVVPDGLKMKKIKHSWVEKEKRFKVCVRARARVVVFVSMFVCFPALPRL